MKNKNKSNILDFNNIMNRMFFYTIIRPNNNREEKPWQFTMAEAGCSMPLICD